MAIFDEASIIAKIRAAAMAGVVDGANRVQAEALRTINEDPKSGRMYGSHQASAPGESPARERGFLAASIDVIPNVPELSATVNAGAAYAANLEFGTAKMAPRPYMRPSLEKFRRQIEEDIQARVAAALK